MPSAGFEHAIRVNSRFQIYTLDHAATRIELCTSKMNVIPYIIEVFRYNIQSVHKVLVQRHWAASYGVVLKQFFELFFIETTFFT